MSEIVLSKQISPVNPGTGKASLFVNLSGVPTLRDETGVETPMVASLDRFLSKLVAGNLDVTLTPAELGNGIFEFTGVLTGNINVIVPATPRYMQIDNLTTGAFTLTVKTPLGTGVVIPQGKTQAVYCNGTNVEDSNSSKANVTGGLGQFAATTSVQLAGVISDKTGTGSVVFNTSPVLITPTLGVSTATSVNKVAITAPVTGATLTLAEGKIFTASNSITIAGTDGSTLNVGTGGTLGTAAFTSSTAYDAAGAASSHAALTAAHGVTGAVVGTTDVQSLSNKTINASSIGQTTPAVGSFTSLSGSNASASTPTLDLINSTPTYPVARFRTTGGDALQVTSRGAGIGSIIAATNFSGAAYANLDVVGTTVNINTGVSGGIQYSFSPTNLNIPGNVSVSGRSVVGSLDDGTSSHQISATNVIQKLTATGVGSYSLTYYTGNTAGVAQQWAIGVGGSGNSDFNLINFTGGTNAIRVQTGIPHNWCSLMSGGRLTLGATDNGVDTLQVGGITKTTGIKFGNVGGTKQTLDFYEEGTWTPADASGAGLVLPTAVGSYQRVGNRVSFEGRVIYPTTTNTLPFRLGGLPFISSASSSPQASYSIRTNSTLVSSGLYGSTSSASMVADKNFGTYAQNLEFSGVTFYFTGSYFI